jgi:plastocyanin
MSRALTVGGALAILVVAAGCSDDPVSQDVQGASKVSAGGASRSSSGGLGGPNDRGPKRYIAVLDDCDPNDPEWAPTGGCVRKDGAVTFAEFNAFLPSPLSLSTVGHPAWRNEPSYVKIEPGQSVRVTNEGGRLHTFTQVANFGGGRVPPLNIGLTPAPECLSPNPDAELPPGATLEVDGLGLGTHKFQCCIHPWMRGAIKVLPDQHGTGA